MTGRRGFAFVVAAIAIVGVGGLAVADQDRTERRLPPVPELCRPSDAACEVERNDDFLDRAREAARSEDDFAGRAWLYSAVAVGLVVAALAHALRGRPSLTVQRRIFADLGVLGVLLVLAAGTLLWRREGSLIGFPAWPAMAPGLVALATSAVGGGRARLLGGQTPAAREPGPQPLWRRVPRYASLGGLALTGATIVLALAYAEAQPPCGSDDEAPGWTDGVGWTGVATGAAASGLALGGLGARRWMVALACLVANPAAALWMLLSTCPFS